LLYLFLIWACIATATIELRYGYDISDPETHGLLRLMKMVLYALAGILTVRAFSARRNHDEMLRIIIVSGIVIAISQIIIHLGEIWTGYEVITFEHQGDRFLATNLPGIMLALIVTYLAGYWYSGGVPNHLKYHVIACVSIAIIAELVSKGRGGWIATLAALGYIIFRRRGAWAAIRLFVAVASFAMVAYFTLEPFRAEVERTFHSDPEYLQRYNSGLYGINDGGRTNLFYAELPKLLDDPLFGRGINHRSSESGLHESGSHNFFLQTFLETGVIGGVLIIYTFVIIWKQTHRERYRHPDLELATKAMLVAAIFAGLGGEYFFNDQVIFLFFLLYAGIGSILVTEVRYSTRHGPSPMPRRGAYQATQR
jgi:O-antigen ligase